MPFRNPVYLNMQVLHNLADYVGMEVVSDAQVTRRTMDESSRRAGMRKVVEVGGERAATEERTEVFAQPVRPIRLLNDIVDKMIQQEDIVDLTATPGTAFGQRDVVQVDAELTASPITEVGALFAPLMPLLLSAATTGQNIENLDPATVGVAIFGGTGTPADFTHVFEMTSDVPDTSLLALLDPANLFGDAVMEDAEGHRTVVGLVDRVVMSGESFSLERYLLPGLNRTLRRAVGSDGIDKLLRDFGEKVGRELSVDSITVAGPAALMTPIAIF